MSPGGDLKAGFTVEGLAQSSSWCCADWQQCGGEASASPDSRLHAAWPSCAVFLQLRALSALRGSEQFVVWRGDPRNNLAWILVSAAASPAAHSLHYSNGRTNRDTSSSITEAMEKFPVALYARSASGRSGRNTVTHATSLFPLRQWGGGRREGICFMRNSAPLTPSRAPGLASLAAAT